MTIGFKLKFDMVLEPIDHLGNYSGMREGSVGKYRKQKIQYPFSSSHVLSKLSNSLVSKYSKLELSNFNSSSIPK